jgi:hypothetical protein
LYSQDRPNVIEVFFDALEGGINRSSQFESTSDYQRRVDAFKLTSHLSLNDLMIDSMSAGGANALMGCKPSYDADSEQFVVSCDHELVAGQERGKDIQVLRIPAWAPPAMLAKFPVAKRENIQHKKRYFPRRKATDEYEMQAVLPYYSSSRFDERFTLPFPKKYAEAAAPGLFIDFVYRPRAPFTFLVPLGDIDSDSAGKPVLVSGLLASLEEVWLENEYFDDDIHKVVVCVSRYGFKDGHMSSLGQVKFTMEGGKKFTILSDTAKGSDAEKVSVMPQP